VYAAKGIIEPSITAW